MVTWDTCPDDTPIVRQSHSSDQPGIEPATFYCFGPSKKPWQRDFLLLTLSKLLCRYGFLPYLNLVPPLSYFSVLCFHYRLMWRSRAFLLHYDKTWCVKMDSNHQQYHTKRLAAFQGTRTLCPNRRRAVYQFQHSHIKTCWHLPIFKYI